MAQKRKLNVAVLMGGRTAEHEVSLASGQLIVQSLDRTKYNIKPITITKEGQWLIPTGYLGQIEGAGSASVADSGNPLETAVVPVSAGTALDRAQEEQVDVVFLALHGPYGEDGTIQGLLELANIPYTGSGVLASALAMHKVRTLQLLTHVGLTVPRYCTWNRWEWERSSEALMGQVDRVLGWPCVVLPVELGSSVGVTIAGDEAQLRAGVEHALSYGNEVLVEEYLRGDEVTCAVLGGLPGKEPIPLVPTHIIPRGHVFFDYEAKYTPGATEEVTPPRLPASIIADIQRVAVTAHTVLGCAALSRTDMIVRDGIVYVLETNTLPGMTPTSLFPQAARAAGFEFPQVLDRIIELAIAYHDVKRHKVTRQ